jgi:hypothetical protein
MLKLIFLIIIVTTFENAFSGAETQVLGQAATGAATGAATSAAKDAALAEAAKNNTSIKELSEKFEKFMSSPTGVGIASSVGLVNSLTLRQAAAEQSTESAANITKIETLMTAFKDSWAKYCPNGRDSLSEPSCYCYLESGAKNTNRSNSETCTALWASTDYKITASSASYKSDGTTTETTGCVTSTGSYDENCNCKKILTTSGSNSCAKTTALGAVSASIGTGYITSSGVSSMASAVNKLASANATIGDLDGKSLAIAFKKQSDINNKIFESTNKNPDNKMQFPLSTDQIKSAQNQLFSKAAMSALASKSSGSFSIKPPASSALAKAVKEIEAKTGLELTGSGKGLGTKKEESKQAMNFNFNDQSGGNSGSSNAVDFMDKNYKYKANDISKSKDTSIFEIISNRYVETGLKKLFSDDK